MDRIEDCISFIAGKAYQQISQEAKRRLAPFGVTPPQYALLKVLWERDGQSGAELGERLVFDSATMTGLIDRLAQADFVERRADPADRRVNRVFLTERGRALRRPLDREMDAMNADFLGRFSRADAAKLRELLEQLSHLGAGA